jgi:hypothetical protein
MPTRRELMHDADALLRKANRDIITGQKKDAAYRKRERWRTRRAKRRAAEKAKLGTFGPASEVRTVKPDPAT